MKKLILSISIFTLILSFRVSSQVGPTVECFNCDGAINKPLPVSGSWYNPDQPGTGYVLEVQNGRLLAYYYGYDSNGEQQWLITQGDLESSETEDVIWKTTGEFLSFKNGNAFNQTYQFPESELSGDTVTFEFISKNNARISVNGEPHQNFIPLEFGVGLSRDFQESSKLFPDLTGMWSFVYKKFSPETVTEQFLYTNDIYYIDKGVPFEENGTKFTEFFITKYIPFPPFEVLGLGKIECSNPINELLNARKVICELIGFPAEPLGNIFSSEKMVIHPGDLGAFSFSAEYINPGEPESGFIIEASRVNYIGLGE